MLTQLNRFASALRTSIGTFGDKSGLKEKVSRVAADPGFQRHVPAAEWLSNYNRDDLSGDMTGGVVVAIMLVPQSMAYALLAGLSAQVGLYASILPLLSMPFSAPATRWLSDRLQSSP